METVRMMRMGCDGVCMRDVQPSFFHMLEMGLKVRSQMTETSLRGKKELRKKI